jgi:DNA mismatch repair protein MutS
MAKTNKPTETPLMEQYNQMKALHGDAIMLFRVGDFYETFGQDAIITASVLGITLTARNNGGSPVELAGFPHHSLDNHLPKLVKAGYRVAVCDQLEKPDPKKKIVKRGITELVTPGVALSENILDHRANNYLACVHISPKEEIGLAFLDISTGEFLVSEGDAAYMEKLLQSFQPAEVLHAKSKQKDLDKRLGDRYYRYALEEWVFTEDYTQEKLLNQFEVASLKGFGIAELGLAQIAAGAILHYISTTQHKNLRHINTIARIQPDKYVWLDRFTVRNLELVTPSYPTGVPLLKILDKTISPMGTRLLRKWVLLPLKEPKPIQARLETVKYLLQNHELADLIRQQIQQIGDMERLIAKAPLGRISPREMRALHRSLNALAPIKTALTHATHPALQSLGERIQLCELINKRIGEEVVENPPVKMDEGGYISDGISDELDDLRQMLKNTNGYLAQMEQKAIAETGISSLKIGRNDVFGYYFEVTNRYKDSGLVPEKWYRKQTLTNAERYTTEELKEMEVKMFSAEEKSVELERKLFQDLVQDLQEYLKPIQINSNLVAQLDCFHSFAQIAEQNQYCCPQINEGFSLDIKNGRHPVIEKQLKIGETYVPNDIFLDADTQQIMMITGPNMAGKSALLRQTALICLMAQMGSFVPASSANLGIVDKIFTRVGASDNISSGESTFMVEMNETASILNNISDRSLILLDEIGRGTSTYDGISIAWAIAEYLHESNLRPKTLFATHYHELNQLSELMPRVKNFNVATKEIPAQQKIIFLRKLQAGGAAHSFGIHVARIAGMPKLVLERADAILKLLESKDIEQPEHTASRKVEKAIQHAPPMQAMLFMETPNPQWDKLKTLLQNTEVNRMTPVDCMLKLIELKRILEES